MIEDSEYLKDRLHGKKSSMRLICVFGVLIMMVVWAIISLSKMEIQSISYEFCALVFVFVCGKSAQKYIELMNERRKPEETKKLNN